MSHKPKKTQANAKIRIIGGDWRGRRLRVLDREGLRPSSNRVRETLFNWLTPHISGARCLDAFAGTGALGLEAISRGAAFTQFVELEACIVNQLRKNLELLDVTNARVDQADFNLWHTEEAFDIVFLDPPFGRNLWSCAIENLGQNVSLTDRALIYVEAPLQAAMKIPANWILYKQKIAGQVCASLYETILPNPR